MQNEAEFTDLYRDLAEQIEQAVGGRWSEEQYNRAIAVLRSHDRVNGNEALAAAASVARRVDEGLADKIELLRR